MSENKVETRIAALEKAVKDLVEQQQKILGEQSPFTAASRQERMTKVLEEWSIKKEAEDLEKIKKWDEARAKTFDEKFAIYKAEAEQTDEEVLRRFLGVNKDEPLKMSDLPKMIDVLRKAMLEKSDAASRSPAPSKLEKGSPDGTTAPNAFEKMVTDFEQGGKKQ